MTLIALPPQEHCGLPLVEEPRTSYWRGQYFPMMVWDAFHAGKPKPVVQRKGGA